MTVETINEDIAIARQQRLPVVLCRQCSRLARHTDDHLHEACRVAWAATRPRCDVADCSGLAIPGRLVADNRARKVCAEHREQPQREMVWELV